MNRLRVLLGQRARRDGAQIALWAGGTGLLAFAAYAGVDGTYGSADDRTSLLAAALANPVILLFRGLPSGTAPGAFIVFLIFPWLALLAAFMSTFLAVRHTRGDEEAGRAELVAATPAGRTLPIVATVVHGILANALAAALVAGALIAVGLDASGAVLTGLAVGAVGVVFLGVGLLAAPLVRSSRAANSVSVWTVLVSFVLAGTGNAIGTPSDDLTRMESSWVTWLSPFGWGENTRAFDADQWGPVYLCLVVGLALAAIAVAIASVRDLGSSLLGERRGRAEASALLSHPIGLVWRLTRGALLGWAIGGFLVGMLSTSLASIVADVGATNPAVEDILRQIAGQGSIAQGTVTTFFTMLGVFAACVAVQTVCRARQEEAHGTAEPLLSAPVHRVRWLAGYLVVALLGIAAVIGAGVLGAAAGIAGRDGDASLMRTVLITGAGQVAAASVFLVVTALLFVVAPRLTIPAGWTLVLVAMVLGLFGPLFQFPEWLVHVSPIAVTPLVDGEDVDLRGLWSLLVATAAGATASLALMRRRELAPAG
ncbi:MAG: polyketide antibiotic transporter [Candidatus Microbacterium phytovorans]|uniref:Polyketide antibiotic transporter n=1 Tax=Candidatus Microbacterium phytovorans TaxID=3121374 RepID=A0AAJ6B267_9MICO|nr:polyketide antibiotic transporter [Microbacterium sp.]WEK12858.1 MAG: polyketide antibiotic transporter [Microbacterium sp.]